MRENLVKLRKVKGLTQKEIARIIKISENQYQRLEAGTSDGSVREWTELKKILNAQSIDYLLEQIPPK